MTYFKNAVVGKGIRKPKFQIDDSVTGARKSYACYEVGQAMKSKDLLGVKGSLNKKFQIADSVTNVQKSYTCYEMCWAPSAPFANQTPLL